MGMMKIVTKRDCGSSFKRISNFKNCKHWNRSWLISRYKGLQLQLQFWDIFESYFLCFWFSLISYYFFHFYSKRLKWLRNILLSTHPKRYIYIFLLFPSILQFHIWNKNVTNFLYLLNWNLSWGEFSDYFLHNPWICGAFKQVNSLKSTDSIWCVLKLHKSSKLWKS